MIKKEKQTHHNIVGQRYCKYCGVETTSNYTCYACRAKIKKGIPLELYK